jgi:hypothetical protein
VTGSGDPAQGRPALATPTERSRTPALELELERERRGWYELVGLIRGLTLEERLEPGYAHDRTVRDVVAQLGTWLTLAEVQLERMHGGSYEGCGFHGNPATHSTAIRPVIPGVSGHP